MANLKQLRKDKRLANAFLIIYKYNVGIKVGRNYWIDNEGYMGCFFPKTNEIVVSSTIKDYYHLVFVFLHEIKHSIDFNRGYYPEFFKAPTDEDCDFELYRKVEHRCDKWAADYMKKHYPKVNTKKYLVKIS